MNVNNWIRMVLCLGIFSVANAQDTTSNTQQAQGEGIIVPPLNHGYLTVGVGLGFSSFYGDLGLDQNLTSLNNFRGAFNFTAERRFGKIIGVDVYGVIGKLAQNERSLSRNLNFESSIKQFGINASAHFDWKSTTVFSPYLKAGIGYMMFDTYGDLFDEKGNKYHYWRDGSIRNLPEIDASGALIPANRDASEFIRRDYRYETKLTTSTDIDSAVNYARNTIVFPLTAGVKFKLFEFFETRISGTYNLTMSDYIDNYANGSPDAYVYGQLSLHYTIGKKWVHPKEEKFSKVDFKAIQDEDEDKDGISDMMDECSHTKRGVKVDSKGCPIDDDKDGVPNYLDKEPNTASGATVNRYGVTLTDEDIARLRLMRDSVFAERVSRFYEAIDTTTGSLSSSSLSQFDQEIGNTPENLSSAMPSRFRFADFNSDGLIQSNEVTRTIDGFFEGEFDITVETIMELIDYFFEQ